MKTIKGKTLNVVQTNTHYKACTFYLEEGNMTSVLNNEVIIFENCSFRSVNLALSLAKYSFIHSNNTSFSGNSGLAINYFEAEDLDGEMPPWHLSFASDTVSLNLDTCNLNKLPELEGFSRLERLTAIAGKIEEIPTSIAKCQNLKYLHLMQNNIKNIPIEITEVPLEYINLSENPLPYLPVGLLKMRSLKKLGIRGTNIDQIPNWLFTDRQTKMENLYFSGPCSGYDIIKLKEWSEKNVENAHIDSLLWEYQSNDEPVHGGSGIC